VTRGTVCDFFFTKLRPEKYHTMGSRTMRNRPPQVLNRTRKRGERASAGTGALRSALRRRHARWHTAYPVVRDRRLWQHEAASMVRDVLSTADFRHARGAWEARLSLNLRVLSERCLASASSPSRCSSQTQSRTTLGASGDPAGCIHDRLR